MKKSPFLIFNFPFLSRHPDPSLQASWNYAQLGFLIFPLIPILGAVGIFIGLVGTYRKKHPTIIRRPLNRGFAIFCAWIIISAGFAPFPLEALLGLFNFFPFFIFFAAYSELIQTPAQLRRLAWILVLPSVPVVILGLGQLFLGWGSPAPLPGILGWALQPKGNPIGRMAAVFMYANILAGYLQIVFILGLGLWIEESKKRSPQPSRLRAATLEKSGEAQGKRKYIFPPITWRMGFLSVAVIGNAAALILTNSRNAWAIVVLSCLTFAFYQGWRWLVAIVTGIATSILWAAFGPSPVREWLRTIVPYYFWARLTDQMYPDRPVALLRTTQWQFAWSMTQQRPWTGWGLRNFTPLYEAQMKVWLGHPHSLLLMLTAETGIPATIFFCGLVGWVMVQAVLVLATRLIPSLQDRLILFSYLVAFGACTLFNTVDVTLFDLRVNTLGWLLFAAICGVVYQKRAIAFTLS